MSKGGNPNPSPATRFKPGNTAARGKKLTDIERRVRSSTRQKIHECAEKCMELSVQELEKIVKDKQNNSLFAGVARVFLNIHKKGDFYTGDKVFDRILGKSVQRIGNGEGEKFNITFDNSMKDL